MYEEFLKPTLLIALFAPPEELSAGVVLGAFYFYTLAHQSDFDVCWCKVRAHNPQAAFRACALDSATDSTQADCWQSSSYIWRSGTG